MWGDLWGYRIGDVGVSRRRLRLRLAVVVGVDSLLRWNIVGLVRRVVGVPGWDLILLASFFLFVYFLRLYFSSLSSVLIVNRVVKSVGGGFHSTTSEVTVYCFLISFSRPSRRCGIT